MTVPLKKICIDTKIRVLVDIHCTVYTTVKLIFTVQYI